MKISRHGLGLVGLCLAIVGLSLVSLSGFAQQSPAPASGQLQVRTASPSDARDLTLDVVVTSKSGKAVPGLKETDFTVLDNGHPQKVLAFRASTKPVGSDTTSGDPVKLILLVDEVNTNFDRVSYERDQIKKFLLQNGGVLPYPTSMAFFMDTKTEIQKTTSRDGNALLAVFDEHQTALRTIRRSQGFYGAIERLQASLNTLHLLAQSEAQTPGRKIVVWISPGWPLLSGPGVEISDKDNAKLFAMVTSLSRELREARVTLYSVDPVGAEASVASEAFYYRQFLKPVTSAKKVLPGNLALQVIATQTGGLVLNASNDITDQINRCVADVDAYYTLTIEAAAVERPDEYHSIDVKVATPGLTARTRSGYYAQP
jgi:VWFA-related protein